MLPFIKLGFITVPLYGLCIVAGLLCSGFAGYVLCKKSGRNFYDFLIVAVVAGALGFAGAKILFLLVQYSPKYFFKALYLALFKSKESGLLSGGFVFYGGLIGGIAGYFLGVKIAGCSRFEFLNILAVCIPLAHGFGRIGCFCAGCCYGIEYEGFGAVHYENPVSTAVPGTGYFPVQLLEGGLLFLIAFCCLVLFFYCEKKRINSGGAGQVTGLLTYLCLYSVERFVLEFFRGDAVRGYFGIFSTSQWISVIMFLCCLLLILFFGITGRINAKQEN